MTNPLWESCQNCGGALPLPGSRGAFCSGSCSGRATKRRNRLLRPVLSPWRRTDRYQRAMRYGDGHAFALPW